MAARLMLPITARDIACAAYCRAPGGARFELSAVENVLKTPSVTQATFPAERAGGVLVFTTQVSVRDRYRELQ